MIDHFNKSKTDPRLENIDVCYQCGACTGICPGVEVYEGYNPRKTIHLLSLRSKGGNHAKWQNGILDNMDPSNCFQCYSCGYICPRGVSPGGVMKYLREVNRENGRDRHLGLLRENLIKYGQSIIPEIFNGADRIWGDSWREVKERKEYQQNEPKKRDIPQGVIKEINYLMNSAKKLYLKPPKSKEVEKRDLRKIDKIILFESCCASSHYPGIGRSSKYILDKIGLPYVTLEEQSCCGGFAYYANDFGLNELTLIGARNQSLFENETDVVVSVCPTCFSSNLEVKRFLSEKENKNQINDILSVIDRRIIADLNIVQIEEVLYDNLDLIKDSIELDLSEVRIATHSACHNKYFRSRAEKYDILDELVKITGARLINYSLKDRCCGGGFEKSFVGDIDKVREINYKKQSSIADMEANLVILDCPGCEMTFDRNSSELSKTQPLNLGYMHILEFLALAMDADPHEVAGVQYHTAYDPLLEKLKIG